MLIREILNAWEGFDVFCLWPLKIQQSILKKVTLPCCLTGHVSWRAPWHRTPRFVWRFCLPLHKMLPAFAPNATCRHRSCSSCAQYLGRRLAASALKLCAGGHRSASSCSKEQLVGKLFARLPVSSNSVKVWWCLAASQKQWQRLICI